MRVAPGYEVFIAAFSLLGLMPGAPARSQTPVGSEFQVNLNPSQLSQNPAVGFHANGEFVVAYDHFGYVYGQRFASDGSRSGAEFAASDVGNGGDWLDPMIAIGGDDDQAVMAFLLHDFGDGAAGRLFDSSGTPISASPFIVGASKHNSPGVASDGNGDFTIVWTGTFDQIMGLHFLASGVSTAPAFQISLPATGSYDRYPTVAANDAGEFVVAWHRQIDDPPEPCDVVGRRLDATGSPVGSEFQVNGYTTGCQRTPSVAVEPDGDFLVVWHSNGGDGTDTDSTSIQGQRFASDASPVGAQFQVNSYTTGVQRLNRKGMAMDSSGEFVVTWQSDGSGGTDTSDDSIQAQRFDSAANPVGSEFQVNTYTSGYQAQPAVAFAPNGTFLVAWRSDGSAASPNSSIQAQRFTVPEPLGGALAALLALAAIRSRRRASRLH